MKKLLLILLCLPMIGFGQACQYGSSTDASEICDYLRGNNFVSDRSADLALDKILDVTGMSKRFVLKECSNISNCVATTYKGIRYILYDKEFMNAIATRTNSWSKTSILAHEIGHHVNGHTLGEKETTLSESRQMELEADEYSGFILGKLGASITQAQEAINVYSTNADDSYSTHPSKDKRLKAIYKGWSKAKGQGSNNDYSTNSLTAEYYFYNALNNMLSNEVDYQYQIDNYTKCLRIDPNYYDGLAYNNRGMAYGILGKYEDAIADYTNAIRIDPKNNLGWNAYESRALLEKKIQLRNRLLDYYTETNNITTETGLTYKIINKGSGNVHPKTNNTVKVHYIGMLTDGTIFDNSDKRGEPLEFSLGEGKVILGWEEGIPLLKVGGKAILIIPPHLAYGERAVGGIIPPNSTLIFEVELLEIQ